VTSCSEHLGEHSSTARRIGMPDCVGNATVCCFPHSGALIRIGSFGLIRITSPGSVKRHPQFEEQA